MGKGEVQHKDNLREGEKDRGDTVEGIVAYFHGEVSSEKEIYSKRPELLDISAAAQVIWKILKSLFVVHYNFLKVTSIPDVKR
jgi:hypothetical protein